MKQLVWTKLILTGKPSRSMPLNPLPPGCAFVTGDLNAKPLDAWLNYHCLLLISFARWGAC